MKKINIVKEKKDFDKAFKTKNQYVSKYTYIYIKESDLEFPRFGICISKKVGNAVFRNKTKRRIKDIIDKSKLQFINKDYIIVVKKSINDADFDDIKLDLIGAFQNIIKETN